MTAFWAWRLDPSSGSSSSLGPSTSATLIATGPLSSLAHTSNAASEDGVFWQDFRAPIKRTSLRDRKRAKLHRFDSDDVEQEQDEDKTVKSNEAGLGSKEEDANGIDNTSSEGSDSDEAEEDSGANKELTNVDLTAVASQDNITSTAPTLPHPVVPARRSKLDHADTTASSTQLIAHAIHTHSLASDFDLPNHIDALPLPLSYKETVRLVRLIAMIFRFPKPSRRISRRRNREQPTSDDTNAASSSTATSSAPSSSPAPDASTESTHKIELKSKYLSSAFSSTSSSRRPRMLAKVHPEDARPDSAAVLKLIALIPAALPARVGCAVWIASIAVKASRDEHGNILLPDGAYETASSRAVRAETEETEQELKTEAGEGEEEKKVTRSMWQKLGKEAPSIPLPKFWRKRRTTIKQEDEDECKQEKQVVKPSDRVDLKAEPAEEAEVDALTATQASEPASDSTIQDSSSPQIPDPDITINPEETITEQTIRPEGSRTGPRVVNLSKLLAERMREKRQAKSLLLRTHHSLRKRKREDGDTTDTVGGDGSADAEEEENVTADAETVANTIANRGRKDDVVATPEIIEASADANAGDGHVKQEDLS